MFGGALHVRDRLHLGEDREGTVTALGVFEHGAAVRSLDGDVGADRGLSGLREVRVGDSFGDVPRDVRRAGFAPPPMESAVVPRDPAQRGAMHAALAQLAEQDPLINLRQDDERGVVYLSLYGEVQKEVIAQTLAADLGIDIEFRRDDHDLHRARPPGPATPCSGSDSPRTATSRPWVCASNLATSARGWE